MRGKDEGRGGEDFYAAALTEAERLRLPSAREAEGVEEELAALRARLFTMVWERPERLDLMARGIGMLAHMTALRYRMSRRAEEDLEESLAGVISGIGAALGLGEFGEAAEG